MTALLNIILPYVVRKLPSLGNPFVRIVCSDEATVVLGRR